LATVPSAGLNVHVTSVLLVPNTEATKPTDVPETSDAVVGLTVMEIEFETGDATAELTSVCVSAPVESGAKTKVVHKQKDRRMSFFRMIISAKAFFG
jgi:hypothetical protein